MTVSSAVNEWVVRPGHFNKTTEKLFTSGRDVKDVIDFVSTGLKWFPYFNMSDQTLDFANKTRGDLDPIAQGLSVFSFFSDLNGVRRSIGHYFSSDDTDAGRKLFNSTMCAVNSGSESSMFLDTINIVPLKEGMKAVSGAFWGSAALLSGVDYFYQIGQIEHLSKEIETESDDDIKAVRQDELGLSYLKIVKNITTVALASIILVSLVFAGVASYMLFSPVVQLGLSTTWFVLQFVCYYYQSVIDYKKTALADIGKKA